MYQKVSLMLQSVVPWTVSWIVVSNSACEFRGRLLIACPCPLLVVISGRSLSPVIDLKSRARDVGGRIRIACPCPLFVVISCGRLSPWIRSSLGAHVAKILQQQHNVRWWCTRHASHLSLFLCPSLCYSCIPTVCFRVIVFLLLCLALAAYHVASCTFICPWLVASASQK